MRPASDVRILSARAVSTLTASGVASIGSLVIPSGQPKPTAKPSTPPAAKPRSILGNLLAVNEELVHKVGQDSVYVLEHPFKSLGHMFEGMMFPLLHPIEAAHQLVSNIKADPFDGSLDAAGSVAGSAYLLTVGVALGALLAAPFTGGASLALAMPALAWGNAFGLGCVAFDAGGILLHEVRGAEATSATKAKNEGDLTASYAEDEALNLITWNASSWVQGLLGKGALGTVHSDVAGNIIGSVGVYDPPPPHFNWFKLGGQPHISSGQTIQNRQMRSQALGAASAGA